MRAPDISVIFIAFDVRDEMLTAIESVERHAGGLDVEVIVVDNGSSDGTSEAIAERFPTAELIRLPRNEGVAARNHGLRVATGRHRMFLDSDARVTEGALPELVSFLDDHPEVGLVGPRLVGPDGELQHSMRRFPPLLLPFLRRPPLNRWLEDSEPVRRHLMAGEYGDETREAEYVLGACQAFSARAQRAAGEIDRTIFFGPDDADWCLKMRRAGFKVVYHPAATVVHDYRRSTAGRPLSIGALRHLSAFYRFQWKWRRHGAEVVRAGREIDSRHGRLPSLTDPSVTSRARI